MKAGRDLDALIAEKVFGWTGISHGPGCDCCIDTWEEWTGLPPLKQGDDGIRYSMHNTCGQCGHRPDKRKEFKITTEKRTTIPDYSENIRSAWLIVDKFHNKSFSLSYGVAVYNKWYCGIISYGDYADTAPHAICLAALKAVGYKYEDVDGNGY